MKHFVRYILCLVASVVMLALCANAQKTGESERVAVQVRVVEFVPHWIWSPQVAKDGARPVFGGCRAKVVVMRPSKWTKKEFWLDFASEPEKLAKDGLSFEAGATFSMSLPLEFIQGNYPSIPEWEIHSLAKEPNQAPEPTPTAVTPPAGQEARQP